MAIASNTKLGNEYLYSSTILAGNYEFSFGTDDDWSSPISFDFLQPRVEIYIVNNLDPSDPNANKTIRSIKHLVSNNKETLKMIIDLRSTNDKPYWLSKQYSELISPLSNTMVYQVIHVNHR